MKGEVKVEYLKNRIGVCVLLPLKGVVGVPCNVTAISGSFSSHFPDLVSSFTIINKRNLIIVD